MVQQFDINSGRHELQFHGRYPGTYNLSVTNTTSRCTNSSNSLLVLTLAAPLISGRLMFTTGGCPILKLDGNRWLRTLCLINCTTIRAPTNSNFTACYPGTYNLSVTNTTSRCTNSSNLLVISPRDYPIVTILMPCIMFSTAQALSYPELVGNRWLRTLCLSMVQQFDINSGCHRLQFHGLLSGPYNASP